MPGAKTDSSEAFVRERFEDRFAEREREAAPRRVALAAEIRTAASRPLNVAGSLADTGDHFAEAGKMIESDIGNPISAAEESPEVAALRRGIAEVTAPEPLRDKGSGAETSPKRTTPAAIENCAETAELRANPVIEGDTLRAVAPLDLGDLQLHPIPTARPLVEWMAPADLLIDGAYQRDLSPKSEALIRRVTEGWDWRRFKPPIVAWTEAGFEIIDGQHTAIAAATRGIEKIPVLVVEAAEQTDRAGAFIGHNRDRLAVTPTQMHHAAVAAGDEDAVTVQQVCDRAGVKLITSAFGGKSYKVGETQAVGAIQTLVKRRFAKGAREVLDVLVKAEQAPVTANGIKAVEMLMTDPDYAGRYEPDDLSKAIQTMGAEADKEAKVFAGANCVPLWKGLAVVWFRKTRKRRDA